MGVGSGGGQGVGDRVAGDRAVQGVGLGNAELGERGIEGSGQLVQQRYGYEVGVDGEGGIGQDGPGALGHRGVVGNVGDMFADLDGAAVGEFLGRREQVVGVLVVGVADVAVGEKVGHRRDCSCICQIVG